ncbi:MarR family winged helix-turn-helix transcriptional regulator [Halomonas sp. I5-271120]|uniref:MarR family winged helix-turn-helix transcriptional regulator n=1 Tax=Halomonas sp. I5-271120 TaxID=3061632 RepID=UPI002714C639|nr:MarR family winged helix-turn-helix transcriptional regulator [Halomonas sp. I5-271120]
MPSRSHNPKLPDSTPDSSASDGSVTDDSVSDGSVSDDSAPRDERPELDLGQFLPYRLNSLADRISQALSRIYGERFGITIAEWRVLAWLSHREELTAKQIGEHTRMDKAKVSRAIQALESRALIRRTQSAQDQRVHYLHLTQEGEALLSELIPQARAWETELLATLSSGEYRDLLNTMSKLERQLTRLER